MAIKKKKTSANAASGERDNKPDDLGIFRKFAGYVGIAGAGGGGFAALSFAIGYLAITAHDRMLGLPTTAISTATYVRTGSLFFPNSIYYLLSVVGTYLLIFVVVILVANFIYLIVRNSTTPSQQHSPGQIRRRNYAKLSAYLAVHLVLVFLSILLLRLEVAALDPINTDLLTGSNFTLKNTATSEQLAGSEPEGNGPSDSNYPEILEATKEQAKQLWGIATRVGTGDISGEIKRNLTSLDNSRWLHRFYVWQLGILIALIYSFVMLKLWERTFVASFRNADVEGAARTIRVMRWTVQPLVFLLITACGLNIPANYGVLTLPNNGVWVNLEIKGTTPRSGYLFSDITSEAKEIWILEYEHSKTRWALAKVKRDDLEEIEMTGNVTKNILNPVVQGN